ncbi:MAG TPA: ATP-binding protein, partial [Variovorax sp.]
IEIEDTGPGMSAEELGRIFEPFARGAIAGPAAPGAGLGLTIAKMLIDLMGGEMHVQSTPGLGSVFRLRLFLPRLHQVPLAVARRVPDPAPRPRHGYEGPRRRVLVVDNEEADRELLVQVLGPLGFELRTAASGHDALDLVAAGWRPDAMLVDLAMPGIDGWETIRRARALGLFGAAVAIVSANAFDKRLDNDVGIAPEDFFVKPVRHSELIEWLERRLFILWTENAPALAAPPVPASAAVAVTLPSTARLRALEEAVSLGYFRGIMNQLDDIDAAEPACAPWTAVQRSAARQFQFEAISRALSAAAAAGAS